MSETEQPVAVDGGELPPHVKLLKRIVYIMGLVLVALFLALVAGIIWKSQQRKAEVPQGPAIIDPGFAAPQTVQDMALDGDRLAIDLGSEILVVDVRRNAVVSRILLQPK